MCVEEVARHEAVSVEDDLERSAFVRQGPRVLLPLFPLIRDPRAETRVDRLHRLEGTQSLRLMLGKVMQPIDSHHADESVDAGREGSLRRPDYLVEKMRLLRRTPRTRRGELNLKPEAVRGLDGHVQSIVPTTGDPEVHLLGGRIPPPPKLVQSRRYGLHISFLRRHDREANSVLDRFEELDDVGTLGFQHLGEGTAEGFPALVGVLKAGQRQVVLHGEHAVERAEQVLEIGGDMLSNVLGVYY